MTSVLGAFLLIMITGGCIAYFGDRLGYQMGKKRVTLFGLRPRHTAQVLTVASGIVIGGLALLALLVVNYTFRRALLNGEQLLRTNHGLIASERILRMHASRNELIAQQTEAAAATAQQDAKTARAVLVVANKNLAAEQKQSALTKLKLAAQQMDLKKLTAQLTTERQQLFVVDASVKVAYQDLKQGSQISHQEVAKRRSGVLIYRDGQELGRAVLLSSEPQSEIRIELVRFLNRLSRSASGLGATPGGNHRTVVLSTIYLFDEKYKNDPTQSSQVFIDESESLDALSYNISKYGHGSVVVIAKAFGNSYSGEQVVLLVRAYANLLAIQSGTVLGQIVIDDGAASADEIASELQRFLIEKVRPTAIEAGVIPEDNPQVGAVELGDVSLDQIYDVVRKVHDIDGPSVITAVAAADTFSADKLALVFTVKPANTNSQ